MGAVLSDAFRVAARSVARASRAMAVFNRLRNDGRGRSRSASAICSIVISGSGIAASHPRAQRLERAKLELLDGALRLVHALRDLADAPLVDEPVDDHRTLIRGEGIEWPEQARH